MKTRILTALMLLPLAIGAILWLPNGAFAVLMAVLMGIAGWEWGRLARLSERAAYGYALLIAGGGALGWWLTRSSPGLGELLKLTALWWLLATLWVLVYPRGLESGADRRAITAFVGLWVLIPAYIAMVALQGEAAQGPERLLAMFGLIWAADSGAYFAGKSFGKHKLAPQVSPGKTWEGVLGGLAASGLVAWVFATFVFKFGEAGLLRYCGLALAVVAISVVGDLTESMFKRHAGVKDSGNLFPGHGGMLDRADSVFAAAPCYLLGLGLFGL